MVYDMHKKDCALVFGITGDYTFALGNVLLGLKKHCKTFWNDIIIFHTDVTVEHQEKLNSILKCKFINFGKNEWCKKVLDAMPANRYSIATFFRYECFNLLTEYKKVLWSDVDILVQSDFSDILAYGDISGYACTRSHEFTPIEANFSQIIEGYDMFIPIYNAGFLLITDILLKYGDLAKWCYEKTIELADILRMPDQGILNLMLQDFNIKAEEIDIYKFHCFTDWPQALDPSVASIVHAYSPRKFWNNADISLKFPEWSVNNSMLKDILLTSNSDKVPVISVIMSIYERTKYLDESMRSILNQTFTDFEFILVIEFSEQQNKIEKKLLDYNDDRIKIVKNELKLGFSASLNAGLKVARGKFIARMDDDDISDLRRFQKQIDFLSENPDISMCGTHVESFGVEHNIWNAYPTDPEDLKIFLLFRNALWHPTMMMRRSDIEKFQLYYDEDVFTEDYDLWARAVQHVKISNVPEILLKYRLSGENTTWKHTMKMHMAHLAVMKMQFINYLNLMPTNDELHLINGRIDLLSATYVHSRDVANKVRKDFIGKIIESNKATCFYSQEKLEKFLNIQPQAQKAPLRAKRSFKSLVKRVFKRLMRPFYRPLYNKFDIRINKLKNDIVNEVVDRLR